MLINFASYVRCSLFLAFYWHYLPNNDTFDHLSKPGYERQTLTHRTICLQPWSAFSILVRTFTGFIRWHCPAILSQAHGDINNNRCFAVFLGPGISYRRDTSGIKIPHFLWRFLVIFIHYGCDGMVVIQIYWRKSWVPLLCSKFLDWERNHASNVLLRLLQQMDSSLKKVWDKG